MKHPPVLLIGLDAAELTLVHSLCARGELPALQSLRERGRFGALATDAMIFAGGVWPTFYTGSRVPWHGIYHNKLWRLERMRCEIASEEWLPAKAFWEWLEPEHGRGVVIDVPMTLRQPRLANGVQISGWGTHDLLAKGTWPPLLARSLAGEFGRPKMTAERFGPQRARTLLALREELLRTTEQIARLSTALLARESWSFFLVVLGTLHRGGHYLYDLSQIDAGSLAQRDRSLLEGTLSDLYRAADSFVGACLARAPDARVLVFAVHGMGPNVGWADRCTELLSRIQQGAERRAPKIGLLYSIKRRLPWSLVREVTMRLPPAVTDWLVTLWSARMFDWKSTRYFPLPMDAAGYVRVNLAGREAGGIVEPGDAYRALCDEIERGFLSFRDARSGKPIVRRVHRARDLAGDAAPYADILPDLVVEWADVRATECGAVSSDAYGEIRWEAFDKLPSGRSGNHTSHGWFVAAGPGIEHGEDLTGHHVVDLVPTILHWLDAPQPKSVQGRVIREIA